MKRILIPTCTASDWRRLLADPKSQWKRQASALELAVSWERAEHMERGIPSEVAEALDRQPLLSGATLLLALPEHEVELKGRGHTSQTDLWALLLCSSGSVSMAVEGKAREPFGQPLSIWYKNPSEDKRTRLRFICEVLAIDCPPPLQLRYQLFHRTASAVLEARRFNVPIAVLLVQAFNTDETTWRDFSSFVSLFGKEAVRGSFVRVPRAASESLFLGWVDSTAATDEEVANVI